MTTSSTRKILTAATVALAIVALSGCEKQGSAPAPTITAPAVQHGAHWSALQGVKQPANAFGVSAVMQQEIAVGDAMEFKVRSARDGYLHIVQVDGADNVTAMLPHAAFGSNTIEAGQEFTFPPANSNIKIRAQEPLGESLLAFVVTRENLPTAQVFPELFGESASKGLAVVADGGSGTGTAPWSIARYSVNVVAASQ